MARLGCSCGAVMSTVDCPSPHIYHIFTQDEVDTALSQCPDCPFWDFYTNWDSQKNEKRLFTSEEYALWYCTACGRMYQVQAKPQGRWVKKYRISDDVSSPANLDIANWNKLYIYSDIDVEQITEENFNIKLRDFINHKRHIYDFRISPDSATVVIYNKKDGAIAKVYLLEDSIV